MSATAACCGEMNMPVAAPVTKAAARNTGSDVVNPTSTVDTADTVRPTISSLRRPTRSDRYPLGITAETLPIANVASASPAMPGAAAQHLDDEQRHQRDAQAERRPARREVREQCRAVGAVAQRRSHRDRRLGRRFRRAHSANCRRLMKTTAAATSSATP